MLPQIVSQSTEYAQEIAVLVAQMPVEQAMQVYDFVLDLQMRAWIYRLIQVTTND